MLTEGMTQAGIMCTGSRGCKGHGRMRTASNALRHEGTLRRMSRGTATVSIVAVASMVFGLLATVTERNLPLDFGDAAYLAAFSAGAYLVIAALVVATRYLHRL